VTLGFLSLSLWQPRYPALSQERAGPEALRPKVSLGLPLSVDILIFNSTLRNNIFFFKKQEDKKKKI